jgi:hypothetical protein
VGKFLAGREGTAGELAKSLLISERRARGGTVLAFPSRVAPMNQTPPTLSPEEQEQILQTIEMFEVIVQANPQDCQSMEILKDAYVRLGMKKEMVNITKRLARTFTELGQLSTAMLEYELIHKVQPEDVEVIALMGDLEEQMNKASRGSKKSSSGVQMIKDGHGDAGTLMATAGHDATRGIQSGCISGGADG